MAFNTTTTINFTKWNYEQPQIFHAFWFENLDYDGWKSYAALHWTYSFYVSALYLFLILVLKYVMKNRKPFKLQWVLITWNCALGLFSVMGFLRTGQELVNVWLLPDGFHKSICSRIGLNPPAAFYSVTFALSKYLELGDTLFIILRKQPLVFLQWYHHCTTLILAWQVMPFSEPIFRWYGVMNYGIHSVMYPYFALKVMNYRIPRKISMIITTLQLLQMVIGVGINVYSVYVINTNGPDACARDPVSIKWIGGIYATFVVFFAHFFYERYISKKTKTL